MDSLVVEARRFLEPLSQTLPLPIGPRLQGLGQRRPRNGVGQERQDSDQQIVIHLVHVDPLRRLSPSGGFNRPMNGQCAFVVSIWYNTFFANSAKESGRVFDPAVIGAGSIAPSSMPLPAP